MRSLIGIGHVVEPWGPVSGSGIFSSGVGSGRRAGDKKLPGSFSIQYRVRKGL